jgi:hypothetical protein
MTTAFSSSLEFNARFQWNCLFNATQQQANIDNGRRLLFSPKPPDRLWGLPSLLFELYRGCSLEVRLLEREVDHSPPSSTDVKYEFSYVSAPHKCLHGVYRKNCTFLFWSDKQWGVVEQNSGMVYYSKHLLWYMSQRRQYLTICEFIAGRVANDNVERTRKEAVLVYSRCYTDNACREWKKTLVSLLGITCV